MASKKNRKAGELTPSAGQAPAPAPKKRFRMEKLEERIAPKAHTNPQSKWVGSNNSLPIAY